MPSKADTAVARTIGIDTGKNTLHMFGWMRKARSYCAKRSLGPGLPHDLRTFRHASSASKPAWLLIM